MPIRSFAAIAAAQLVFAVFAIIAFSAAANAQQFLSFVSDTGKDTNTCFVQASPCRTLQRAVNVTSAGGTIHILSDLPGTVVSVTKSITINGGGNSVIGAITINSASAVVTLRSLALTGRGAVATGIRIDSAAAVYIEDCTVERYTNDGIKLVTATASKLFVSDTVSHANGSDGLYVDAVNAQVVIQNSRFEANASTGVYLKVRRASVFQSVALGNTQRGIILYAGSANFTETTVANNGNYGFFIGGGGALLSSSVAHGNTGWGLYITSGATAMITHSIFSQNSTGIYNDGTLNTFRDNVLIRNNSFGYQGSGLKQDELAF